MLDVYTIKQKKLPVCDIKGFFFRIRTHVKGLVLRTLEFTWVLMRGKNRYDQYASFVSVIQYAKTHLRPCIWYIYRSEPYTTWTDHLFVR